MSTTDFVELWAEGENSFESDPPNAVLSFIEPGDTVPEDTVIVIKKPRLSDGGLTYTIDVLEGTVPAKAGPDNAVHRPVRPSACHPSRSAACVAASAGGRAGRI